MKVDLDVKEGISYRKKEKFKMYDSILNIFFDTPELKCRREKNERKKKMNKSEWK